MIETNRIDLSIPYNQNILITTFNEFFNTQELEEIDLSHIHCPADDEAISACHGMEYEKELPQSSFKIKCILDTNVIPPEHHVRLEFCKDELYQTYIECNPNFKNPLFMSSIITKAINFSKYKSHSDPHYNRRSIIKNASKRLAEIIPDFDDLIRFRGRIAEDLYLNEYYKKIDGYFTVSFDYYTIRIEPSYEKILKVDFANEERKDYFYISQTDIGINILLLIIDKAVVLLKDEALDKIKD